MNLNNVKILYRKFLHTFLTPKFLWNMVIKNYDLNRNVKRSIPQKIFFKIFWFWPTLWHVSSWHNQDDCSDLGYSNYINMDKDVQCLMDEVVRCTKDRDARIFDIGCNVGRCLNYLQNKGYTNLYGVDVGEFAIKAIPNTFPHLKDSAHIELKTTQEFLLGTEDRFFSTTYTMGATVELMPSSFPLIKEITRVTSEYVCFMIFYSGHSFPRFWEYEFQKYSFILVKKYMYSLDNNTKGDQVLLLFKRQ